MRDFEELLREAAVAADEQPGRDSSDGDGAGGTRSRWAIAGAVGAVLLGVAGMVGALVLGAGIDARAALDAAEASPRSPAPSAAPSGPALIEPEPATTPDDGAAGEVDPAWVADTAARTGIPQRALAAYARAANRLSLEQPGCGVGWNTLAGIGLVESEHGAIGGGFIARDGRATPPIRGIALDGTSTDRIPDTDGGVYDHDTVWDRAVGPMQFIPSTWESWGADGDGDGVVDPQQIDDAAYSAARYLCAAGGDLRDPQAWIAAVASYNDTIDYNHRVAEAATAYAMP